MCWLKNKLIAKTLIWLVAEIVFNFVGIDDLADYSEFVFENNSEKNLYLRRIKCEDKLEPEDTRKILFMSV